MGNDQAERRVLLEQLRRLEEEGRQLDLRDPRQVEEYKRKINAFKQTLPASLHPRRTVDDDS